MERLADLDLISETYTRDTIGQEAAQETRRTVLCSLHGITGQEWARAAQQGLQPELMCQLGDSADYDGEKRAALNGVRYSVYRTFLRDDGGVELYLRRDVGS